MSNTKIGTMTAFGIALKIVKGLEGEYKGKTWLVYENKADAAHLTPEQIELLNEASDLALNFGIERAKSYLLSHGA